MREDRSLTYLFITHDLSVVEHFGTRVAVMYLGTVCELTEPKALFAKPLHPYSQLLLSAVPKLGRKSFKPVKVPKKEFPYLRLFRSRTSFLVNIGTPPMNHRNSAFFL